MSLSEDRIKHLEFIQDVIARQAAHSFAAKGWSVTVCTAAYFYAISQKSIWLAALAIVPAFLFGYLDAYYLRNERAFRCLYKEVAEGSAEVKSFSMDVSGYLNAKGPHDRQWGQVFSSLPWFAMHVAVIAMGVLVLGLTIVRVAVI